MRLLSTIRMTSRSISTVLLPTWCAGKHLVGFIVLSMLSWPCLAVSLSADGAGQVNLIPFYTTRAGHVTSLTVTNQNRLHSKVVRVRFREALMGAPVLDLNVFLAPRDVWSASISDSGSGARLSSTDASCTVPTLPAAGVDFVNAYYGGLIAGTLDDGRGSTLDRTREGYVEVFEMGVVADGADPASSPATVTGLSVASTILRARNPATRNCGVLQIANPFPQSGDLLAPAGDLSSNAILIHLESGSEYVIPASGLQRFFVPVDRTADLYTEPGSLKPDLASVTPARSDVPNPSPEGPPILTVPDWIAAGGEAIDAVSAVLMKPAVMVPHDLSAALQSEIVLVLPAFYDYFKRRPTGSPAPYVARAPLAPGAFATGGVPAAGSSCMTLQAEPATRDGAGVNGLIIQIGPRQFPAPNLPINACSAVVRIVPTVDAASPSQFTLLGSGPAVSGLTLPTATLGLNHHEQGWIALHASKRPGVAAATSSGITVESMDDAANGMVVSSISLLPEGGLGNIAPVHTDGLARRYRGLPMFGFSAIRAVAGGQGYGGAFAAQGRPVPLP